MIKHKEYLEINHTISNKNIKVIRNQLSTKLVEENPEYLFVFAENSKLEGYRPQLIIRECQNVFPLTIQKGINEWFKSDDLWDILEKELENLLEIHLNIMNKTSKYKGICFQEQGIGSKECMFRYDLYSYLQLSEYLFKFFNFNNLQTLS